MCLEAAAWVALNRRLQCEQWGQWPDIHRSSSLHVHLHLHICSDSQDVLCSPVSAPWRRRGMCKEKGTGSQRARPTSLGVCWAQVPPSLNLGLALRSENLDVYTWGHHVRWWRCRHFMNWEVLCKHETSGKQKWGSALPWKGPASLPFSLPAQRPWDGAKDSTRGGGTAWPHRISKARAKFHI